MTTDIDTAALSPVAAHIVELIGLEPAMRLFGHFGGVRVYVPETVPPEHALVRLLGQAAATELSAHFAREYLDIPKALSALQAARNARIIGAHQDGRSARDLALEHGLTERRIYHILAASRTIDDAQLGLF